MNTLEEVNTPAIAPKTVKLTSIFGAVPTPVSTTPTVPNRHLTRVQMSTEQSTIVVPFTDDVVPVAIHFDKTFNYVTCNGTGCAVCAAGYTAQKMILLPIYSPIDQEVQILAMSDAVKPNSLAPKLMPHIASVNGAAPQVLSVSKPDNFSFSVDVLNVDPAKLSGAASVIQGFQAQFAAGLIDITSIYRKLSNEQMREINSVGMKLSLLGL